VIVSRNCEGGDVCGSTPYSSFGKKGLNTDVFFHYVV